MKMSTSILTAAAALTVALAGGTYAADNYSDNHGSTIRPDMDGQAGGTHAGKNGDQIWGNLASLHKLKGMKVNDSAGNHVGSVDDVVFDTSNGRIAFLVVGAGGILGIGEKKHPVPFEAARFQADQSALSLNLDKDRLKNAPEIRKDMSYDHAFTRQLDQYYGVSPSWSGSNSGDQSGSSMMHNQQRGSEGSRTTMDSDHDRTSGSMNPGSSTGADAGSSPETRSGY